MAKITVTAMSPAEIHARLGNAESAMQMQQDAAKAGVRFGRFLELINPSEKGDSLDAFERQLREADIITDSDPVAGYWASEGGCFVDDPVGKNLYPEFFARNWQRVMHANRVEQREIQQRAILLSSDSIVGGWDAPYADAQNARWRNRLAPPIPLSELVAMTTPIRGADYRTIFMSYDAEEVRMYRVGESASIPITTLSNAENTIRLRKYGRGIRASYEEMRRLRVDKIAWFIQWAALQSQIDKVAAVIATAINGDGNPNTSATEYNLLTLDPAATVNELSLKGWLAFRMQFSEAYTMTTALARLDTALQILLLNTGSGNVPLVQQPLGGISTQVQLINRTGDAVRLGYTNEAPSAKILGMDASMAIEHVQEIGSQISEMERVITNQTQVLVMTEVEGFAVLDPGASKVLDLAE